MKSTFLPRLSLARGETPILPVHEPTGPAIQLSDLPPHPDDAFLSPDLPRPRRWSSSDRRSNSTSGAYSDNISTTGSASKLKPRALFSGPPPPIAASRVLYRDEEDAISSAAAVQSRGSPSLARTAINSVLFSRRVPSGTREQSQNYELDTAWRNLQRREKTLQEELQHFLDIQSAGLAGTLDPAAARTPNSQSTPSEAGSSTPTGTLYTAASATRHSRIAFDIPVSAVQGGEVIPVRQPRQKPLGLRAARSGLAKSMTLLADLKAEEDAELSSALSVRKKALSQLRKLSARKNGIIDELNALESDENDPLAKELRELGEEQVAVTAEISELEERLVGLRNRRRWLLRRTDDVRNRRDAGLSGYRGALGDVDGRLTEILHRPPIMPLAIEALGARPGSQQAREDTSLTNLSLQEQSTRGEEFLRMRPDRRTVDMAKDWWESEVRLLEARKTEIDRERSALEEGVEVWRKTIRLISDFEKGLRNEMRGETDSAGNGKAKMQSPEQAMHAQLDKLVEVMAELQDQLEGAEEKSWNLLICAIGAELEAFREADRVLREALRAAGFEIEEAERLPIETFPIEASVSSVRAFAAMSNAKKNSTDNLLALDGDTSSREDNEVPTDLLTSGHKDSHLVGNLEAPSDSEVDREDSENEVPLEFLAEHRRDDDDEIE